MKGLCTYTKYLVLAVITGSSAVYAGTPVLTTITTDKATLDGNVVTMLAATGNARVTASNTVLTNSAALITLTQLAIDNYDAVGGATLPGGTDPLSNGGDRASAVTILAATKLIHDDGLINNLKGYNEYIGSLPTGTSDELAGTLGVVIGRLVPSRTLFDLAVGATGGFYDADKKALFVTQYRTLQGYHDSLRLADFNSQYASINTAYVAEIDLFDMVLPNATGLYDSINGFIAYPESSPNYIYGSSARASMLVLMRNTAVIIGDLNVRLGKTALATAYLIDSASLTGTSRKTAATNAKNYALAAKAQITALLAVPVASDSGVAAITTRATALELLASTQIVLADAQIKVDEGTAAALPRGAVALAAALATKSGKFTDARTVLDVATTGPVALAATINPSTILSEFSASATKVKADVAALSSIVDQLRSVTTAYVALDALFDDLPVLSPSSVARVIAALLAVKTSATSLAAALATLKTAIAPTATAGVAHDRYVQDLIDLTGAMLAEVDGAYTLLNGKYSATDIASLVAAWQATHATTTPAAGGTPGSYTSVTTAEAAIVTKYANAIEYTVSLELRAATASVSADATRDEMIALFAGPSPVDASVSGIRPFVYRLFDVATHQWARGYEDAELVTAATTGKTASDSFTNLLGATKAALEWLKTRPAVLNALGGGAVAAALTAHDTVWKSYLSYIKAIVDTLAAGATKTAFAALELTATKDMFTAAAGNRTTALASIATAITLVTTLVPQATTEFKAQITTLLTTLFIAVKNKETVFAYRRFDAPTPASGERVAAFDKSALTVPTIDDEAFTAADSSFFTAIGGLGSKMIPLTARRTNAWGKQTKVNIPLSGGARVAQVNVTGIGDATANVRQLAVAGLDKDQAQVRVILDKSGQVGLGGAAINDLSLKALTVLGSDALSIVPNGNGVVSLNEDLIIMGDKAIVPTADFGKEESEDVLLPILSAPGTFEKVTRTKRVAHRLTFTSAVPRAIRVVSGATLDLTAFNSVGSAYVDYGKQIVFDGEVSLVLEPGAKIRLPHLAYADEAKAPVLYFNGNSKLIFLGPENRDSFGWRKAYGDAVNVTGYNEDTASLGGGVTRKYFTSNDFRSKILGVGQFWFNKNSRMEIMDTAMVGIESDYRSPKTNITFSVQRKASICIGNADKSGGVLQIGNPVDGGAKCDPLGWDGSGVHPCYPNNEDHPNYDPNDPRSFQPRPTTVDFNLVVDGKDAVFHIDREGFFGLGVGIVNKNKNPNGSAYSSAANVLADREHFGAWHVHALKNVRSISLAVLAGSFNHNKISDGAYNGEGSVMAIGPVADSYYLTFGKETEAIVRGGGNMVFVRSEVGHDSTLSDSTKYPLPLAIWDTATPLVGTSADSGKYSVMASPSVIRGRRSFARASINTSDLAYQFAGPQEEFFLATTLADYSRFGEKFMPVAVEQNGNMVAFILKNGSTYTIRRQLAQRVYDSTGALATVESIKNRGELQGGSEYSSGQPSEYYVA